MCHSTKVGLCKVFWSETACCSAQIWRQRQSHLNQITMRAKGKAFLERSPGSAESRCMSSDSKSPGAWSFPHLGTPTWSFPHPGEYLEANRAPGAVWGTSHSVPQGLGTPSESSRGPSKVLPPERGAVLRTRQLHRTDGPGSGQRRGQGSGSGTSAGVRGPGEDYSDQVTDQTPSRQKEGEKGRLWDHSSGSLEGTT